MGHDNAHSVDLPSLLVTWTTKYIGGWDGDDIDGRRDVGEEIAGGQYGEEDITAGSTTKEEEIANGQHGQDNITTGSTTKEE